MVVFHPLGVRMREGRRREEKDKKRGKDRKLSGSEFGQRQTGRLELTGEREKSISWRASKCGLRDEGIRF